MSNEEQSLSIDHSPPGESTLLGELDKHTAIAGAVILSFIGNGVFIGLPVIMGAVADSLHFSEQQLGWLASAETGGLLVAALITSALVTRVNRKVLALVGVILAAAANLVSAGITHFEPLFAARIVSGLGGGVCYSLGVACLAGTLYTARNFSILIFGLVFMNAVELYTFPTISEHFGVAGIYLGFAVVFGLCLAIIPWIPSHIEDLEEDDDESEIKPEMDAATKETLILSHHHIPTYLPIMCLAAVFFFYITISSFWTYIERAGVHAGFSTDFITNTLTIGTLFSLTGCVAAAWLSNRFGQSRPLLTALLCMAGMLALLALGFTEWKYMLGLFLFNMFWNFVDIYQLGTIGNMDYTGRYAALVPAAQHIANTIGPTIAASMFTFGWDFTGVMLVGVFGSSAAFVMYFFVYAKLKKLMPNMD